MIRTATTTRWSPSSTRCRRTRSRGRDAPLPSARAQLRAADAPVGPYVGYAIAFLPDPLRWPRDARVRPERPAERATRLREGAHRDHRWRSPSTGVRAALIDWAVGVGRRASALRQRASRCHAGSRCSSRVADRLVYAKMRERLGGRLRTPISGGAPLAKEIAEFFDAVGIRILEGYGLTECTTAATTNTPERYRFGTVGPALPGIELRIAEDGELLIRGARSSRLLQGARGDRRGARRGRLAAIGRHRDDRRGRVRHDHRPQEGHPRHGGREEHRAAEPRERPEDVAVRVAGARRRRPASRTRPP